MRALSCMTLVALAAGVMPSPASACCLSARGFRETAKGASVVLVGRVIAVGPEAALSSPDAAPAYVDVAVAYELKGPGVAKIVRVSDGDYFSSLRGGLRGLHVGLDVKIAAESVAEMRKAALEAQGSGGLAPLPLPPGEYVVLGCSTYWKPRRTHGGLGR